jgi:uncharacterized protein (DUF4415 family)
MNKGNPAPLTPALQAELEALSSRPVGEIETIDPECPPTTGTDWKGAVRGAFYKITPMKKPVALWLDADVLACFKKDGEGYQTRINAALREHIMRHRGEP